MRKQLLISVCSAIFAFVAFSSESMAQQKTAKACTDEWRADKANNQAKGITEKAYVAACRGGTAPTATAPAPAPAPTTAAPVPTPPTTGQKTAKAYAEEWRADKANNQAKGITERAYVAACRSGTTPTPTAATPAPAPAPTPPAPAPTAAAPAPAPAAPPVARTAPSPAAPANRTPSAGTPEGAGQFATEAQAKSHCPSDTVVWVNLNSRIYHFSGTHNYGNTKSGAYMCESETSAAGMRAAKNEAHP
jgi:hypothetical protein